MAVGPSPAIFAIPAGLGDLAIELLCSALRSDCDEMHRPCVLGSSTRQGPADELRQTERCRMRVS